MRLHANAALSLKQRERMVLRVVEQGWSIMKAAEAAEVSGRTCSKWVARYRLEGPAGLLDRSSAPRVVANRTDPATEQLLAALRRLRFTAPELSELLGLPCSTISAVLKRLGMGKLGRLGLEPAVRYERAAPGELIHVDVKKLGRIVGGAGKRIRSPRHQRPGGQNRRCRRASRHQGLGRRAHRHRRCHPPGLRRGPARREGRHRRRVPGPRGRVLRPPRHHRPARAHRQRLALPLSHAPPRLPPARNPPSAHTPYRPQTNGKAERFIRTMLTGWAYSGAVYASSTERTAALDGWLWHYNHHRPHQALGRQTPITRLNNLLGTYT
jgi:transposase